MPSTALAAPSPSLIVEEVSNSTSLCTNETMIVSTFEEMNPSRRDTMEDCHVVHAPGTWRAVDPSLAYLGVYDGHGGREMVDYLEYFLAFHVGGELNHDDDASMETRLERAFLMADIHATQCGVSSSGSTVAVCLIKNLQESNQTVIHSANVGDARAVLCHRGEVTRLSQDHRPDDPAEVQRIEKSGGFVFQNRVLGILAVTRSLGDHCMKEFVIAQPYYSQTTIERATMVEGSQHDSTVLILACDGLWDVFEDDEAVDFALRFPGEKTNVAQALAEAAVRRGSTDNITVVVAWL